MASTKNNTRTRKPAADKATAPAAEAVVAEAEAIVEEAAKETAAVRKAKGRVISPEIAAWVAENARPAKASCLCGCGGETKGRFVPGHDATLKVALEATIAHGTDEAQASAKAALAKFGW